MSNVAKHYKAVFGSSKNNLDLQAAACTVDPTNVSHDALLAEIARYEGPGWIEWTDAVRYRDKDGWKAPAGNAPDTPDQSTARVLAGEVAHHEKAASLRFRHVSGHDWVMETIREEGKSCLKFEQRIISAVQIGPNEAQMLYYATYWDVKNGTAKASRFLGFDLPEAPKS